MIFDITPGVVITPRVVRTRVEGDLGDAVLSHRLSDRDGKARIVLDDLSEGECPSSRVVAWSGSCGLRSGGEGVGRRFELTLSSECVCCQLQVCG